jgi:hypothetical protein
MGLSHFYVNKNVMHMNVAMKMFLLLNVCVCVCVCDANSAASQHSGVKEVIIVATHLNGMYSVLARVTSSSCTLTIYGKKLTSQIDCSPKTTSLK